MELTSPETKDRDEAILALIKKFGSIEAALEFAASVKAKGNADRLKSSYYHFFLEFWDTISQEELIENWHIRYICDELQKVGQWVIEGKPKEYDLLISVPPGSSKSSMATILFPVWLWVNKPSSKVISGSNKSTLSIQHAAASRDVMRSTKFNNYFGDLIEMRKDFDAKTLYLNTQGGMRMTTSSGADIIGQHAHLILLDDPCSLSTARSEKGLQTVNEWVLRRINTRKVSKDGTPTIMIMQRLSTGDPAGQWIKLKKDGKAIKHICLPATSDFPVFPLDDTTIYKHEDGTEEEMTIEQIYELNGGLLDPVRMSERILNDLRIELGSIDYAGQFGQQPMDLSGNLIKRNFFFRYQPDEIPKSVHLHAYVDTALSEKELVNNDPSGILVFGIHKNNCYLVHYETGRWTLPELKRKIVWIQNTYLHPGRSSVYVENASAAKSLKQELAEMGANVNIILDNIKGGKQERLQEVFSILEARRVGLPEGQSLWVDFFLTEVLAFPMAEHDETVDCLTGALRMKLLKKTKLLDPVRRPNQTAFPRSNFPRQ